MTTLGVLLALGSLVGWGFFDFLIHKTTRRVGVIFTIAYESFFVSILLFPFVIRDLPLLRLPQTWTLLLLLGACIFLATLSNRRALQSGKLSVIAPIVSLELPFTVGLSVVLANERLTLAQTLFILLILSGVVLVSMREPVFIRGHRVWFERGILVALLAAVFLALSSFLGGIAGRRISPLLTVWFVQALLAAGCAAYLIISGRTRAFRHAVRAEYRLLTIQTVATVGAWMCFIYAARFIPISITMAISEGYIALASFLGIVFNRERMKPHQTIGLSLVVLSISFLALMV
jgi:drug/metabolite transporter (DMT)-like permease